ncbi:MAG TPA: putative colanic acid biosynthesis acetyltransferase [Steroidobacteraceae bacterium]|nr:putative colanic acid biosynthesis acetyltransferase [Steroidobacteraceae bacterium]
MTDPPLTDLPANRAAVKYSGEEQLRRVAWAFGRWLLVLSPRPCFAWRRAVLRLFGARIDPHVNVYASCSIYMPWNLTVGEWSALGEDVLIYSLGKVVIGRRVTLSYRAHVCAGTHDFSDPALPLLKPPVVLEDDAWVGTEAFVGPGVTVGAGAIVGARAVVVRGVPPRTIVAGNPARTVGTRKIG